MDWKTPLGYLITFLTLIGTFYPVLLSLYETLCFYAGSCALFFAIAKDITHDLDYITIGEISNLNEKEMSDRLVAFIQQDSEVKELSAEEK